MGATGGNNGKHVRDAGLPALATGYAASILGYLCEVRTRIPAGCKGSLKEVLRGVSGAQMHRQHLLASLLIGEIDGDVAVKAPRSAKRRIDVIREIRCGDDDHPFPARGPVEQLQQGVYDLQAVTRIVASECPPVADAVELIDEEHRWSGIGRLAETLPHRAEHVSEMSLRLPLRA